MLRIVAVLVAVLLGSVQASAENRIALVVANSNYTSDLGALPNPVNDAKLIAASLQKVGFKVTLLLDADLRAMKRGVADFGANLETAGPGTTALFYYAGHGLQVNGVNYLVPVQANIKRQGDVDLEALAAESVMKQIEFSGAKVSIVVLDACRNNPLPRSFRSSDRGLARMDAPTGSFIAYSTAPGAVAADGEGRNSPFASALAQIIVEPGMSVEEVFRTVRGRVMESTNGQQVPWDSSSLTVPFYFVPKTAAVASQSQTQPAAPATSSAAAGVSRDVMDITYWDGIKDSNDPALFEAYLRRFPNGQFTEIAESRLNALGASSDNTTRKTEVLAAEQMPVKSLAAQPAPEPEPEPVQTAELAPPAAKTPTFAPDTGGGFLSDQVSTKLQAYLKNNSVKSGRTAYFFVSENGQSSGTAICENANCQNIPGAGPKGYSGAPDFAGQRMAAKRVAQRECEKGGSSCFMLYNGTELKEERLRSDVELTQPAEPAPTEQASVEELEVQPAAVPSGGITLSPKVADDLKDFLASPHIRLGRPAYFYVSADGNYSGEGICGDAKCKNIPGVIVYGYADVAPMVNQRTAAQKYAQRQCENKAKAGCIMLYSGEKRMNPHQ